MAQTARIPLADALARMQSARASQPAERRRFRRLNVILGGRMMDAQGREAEVRTEDVSPGDARIISPAALAKDERVVIYLDKIGRVSGRVARVSGDGEYGIVFDMSAHKREKLAETLTLIITRDRLGLDADRKIQIPAGKQEIEIHIEGGGSLIGEVVDFSLVGISVKTKQIPPVIGSWVRIGGIHGRIARFIEGGFAIDFESRPKS
ncbi:MAG: PilZ domain-containing protein [Hyphomonadaceae bacterium]